MRRIGTSAQRRDVEIAPRAAGGLPTRRIGTSAQRRDVEIAPRAAGGLPTRRIGTSAQRRDVEIAPRAAGGLPTRRIGTSAQRRDCKTRPAPGKRPKDSDKTRMPQRAGQNAQPTAKCRALRAAARPPLQKRNPPSFPEKGGLCAGALFRAAGFIPLRTSVRTAPHRPARPPGAASPGLRRESRPPRAAPLPAPGPRPAHARFGPAPIPRR